MATKATPKQQRLAKRKAMWQAELARQQAEAAIAREREREQQRDLRASATNPLQQRLCEPPALAGETSPLTRTPEPSERERRARLRALGWR